MERMSDVSRAVLMVGGALLMSACAATGPAGPATTDDGSAASDSSSDSTARADEVAVVIAQLENTPCDRGSFGANLNDVARSIEKQKLLYDTKENTDCSGIFHRALSDLNTRCPGSSRPTLAQRDTRSIAKWYADQGRIEWVSLPLQQDRLIRPGAVLFFGQSGTDYTDSELGSALMYERGKGIDHMGIVTRVEMSDGHVARYWMLHGHGRKGQMAAGVTSTTYVDHTGKKRYNNQNRRYESGGKPMPPYGNWNQHWVAVAPVLEAPRFAVTAPAADELLASRTGCGFSAPFAEADGDLIAGGASGSP